MGNRSYIAANSHGPSQAVDCKDPMDARYWAGKGPWLRAGSCAYRANLILAGSQEKAKAYAEYVERLKGWLRSVGYCAETYHLNLDLELDYAQRYCAWQGDEFVQEHSKTLWESMITDYMRVLDVMGS